MRSTSVDCRKAAIFHIYLWNKIENWYSCINTLNSIIFVQSETQDFLKWPSLMRFCQFRSKCFQYIEFSFVCVHARSTWSYCPKGLLTHLRTNLLNFHEKLCNNKIINQRTIYHSILAFNIVLQLNSAFLKILSCSHWSGSI